jgi:hypothetical protein
MAVAGFLRIGGKFYRNKKPLALICKWLFGFKFIELLIATIVGGYLVRELNWDTDHAKDIEKLINTLNKGKYFQGGSRTVLQNYYKQWEKECGQ